MAHVIFKVKKVKNIRKENGFYTADFYIKYPKGNVLYKCTVVKYPTLRQLLKVLITRRIDLKDDGGIELIK
jgi:hypothetical protein